MANPDKFIVAMLGARMHYAVPRILDEAGRLERFFTDFSAQHGWPRLLSRIPKRVRPTSLARIISRDPAGVRPERITAFNSFGYSYARRRARAAASSSITQTFLWANRKFGELVCASDWADASAVFTFNSAGLEILQRARRDGLFTVSEQTIAPSVLEQRLLREECESHSCWERMNEDRAAADFIAREQSEWHLADLILCGSEFVRDGIAQCGGPVEKCVVVPYGVDVAGGKAESRKQKAESSQLEITEQKAESGKLKAENGKTKEKFGKQKAEMGRGPYAKAERRKLKAEIGREPLHVLIVGAVGLRKGSPYVLEAAKQMKGKAAFRMVGGIGVKREAERQLREHLELIGPVPNTELAGHFAWADVFLLPSLCEGSATVTYEALAHGLPVICTPNTGSVVRDGVEGFIVPIRDAGVIVDRLQRLRDDSELLEEMGKNASARGKEFTVAKYGDRLTAALRVSCSN